MTTAALTTIKSTKLSSKLYQGFTLIELLIVIAILGILAAVVLAAINPAEQLARGRDSGRISAVSQLGHAVQAYFTNQNALPASANTWQTTLRGTADIASVITVPATTGAGTVCTTNQAGNICYTINLNAAQPNDFFVWTALESLNSSTKAGGGAACAAGQEPYAVYDSISGREGLACGANAAYVPASTTAAPMVLR